jgi:RNA polymerase sigma-70 factor, ECF subfamily
LNNPIWINDQAELENAQRGELQSISKIVSQLSRPAFNLAYQILLNIEDAEDCVQDSFYHLWKSKNKFQAKSSLKTYFLRIVINSCYSMLLKKNKFSLIDIDHVNIDQNRESELFGTYKDRKDVSLDIHSALKKLNPKQRMAIVLWSYHDLTALEIGVVMSMNKNSVDQLLFRSKVILKNYLGD